MICHHLLTVRTCISNVKLDNRWTGHCCVSALPQLELTDCTQAACEAWQLQAMQLRSCVAPLQSGLKPQLGLVNFSLTLSCKPALRSEKVICCCTAEFLISSDMLKKTLHLMRHGQTEMNAFLHANPQYSDPMLYDTVLSPLGWQQVAAAASEISLLVPQPTLVVSSPLTRFDLSAHIQV